MTALLIGLLIAELAIATYLVVRGSGETELSAIAAPPSLRRAADTETEPDPPSGSVST